ncbi:hypothetical protein AVEN_138098-1 [Araneus ventricosus]|uniref:Uncharacterized protein n=1 Tax=Araneus ventricosus TaxID=182803 RepID=A0A4Y2QIJ3_ARAVE|nr:hypothetical protein AVEN_138098-1 [Araneus ventricosus]
MDKTEILRSQVRRAKRKCTRPVLPDDRKRHFQLSAVQRPDGTLTSTAEEDLQELLSSISHQIHFRIVQLHAIIRLQSKHPPLTLDDPLFNPSELTAAVKTFEIKFSWPGWTLWVHSQGSIQGKQPTYWICLMHAFQRDTSLQTGRRKTSL